MNSLECGICKSALEDVLYEGFIRIGQFGNFSQTHQTVWLCRGCRAGYLENTIEDYQEDTYRNLVDGSNEPCNFYRKHDHELLEKLDIIKTDSLRGKNVTDIGAGPGAFLDLVSGLAKTTIAVEPNNGYSLELKSKGHKAYPFTTDAVMDWKKRVDLATCFATIEHINDPVRFLRDIRELLSDDGKLLISTPNYDDWLIEFLPETYAPFFFRYVHKWYFNGHSLTKLGEIAGFKSVKIKYVQQYDIGNNLLWIKDKKPSGLGKLPEFQGLDSAFRQYIESIGRSNFIYAWFE